MNRQKEPVTMRFSERTRTLIKALAEKHDMSHTAIVEAAVREKASRENIEIDNKKD